MLIQRNEPRGLRVSFMRKRARAPETADIRSLAHTRKSGLLLRCRSALALTLSLLMLCQTMAPSIAQAQGLPLIRDAEIEKLMQDYAAPILRVAGIGSSSVRVVLVNQKSFNAFVADGRRIFINVGTITQSKTPNEVIGVLAHETGHIAGGHLSRLRARIESMQTILVLATLLGAGVAAVGAATGSPEAGSAGSAILSGSGSIATRSLLSYRRTQELSADRAALNYLRATRQSADGMLTVFRRFADQALLSKRFADPYLQSHPMASDRIAYLQRQVRNSRYAGKKDSKSLQTRHDIARAKIIGFLYHPNRVKRTYPSSDKSIAARYARAIAAHRTRNTRKSLAEIGSLIRSQPNNPYFWELMGQIHLETGKPTKAIAPLQKAVKLAPNAGLIRILLGHAYVASEQKRYLVPAIRELRAGLAREPEATSGFRHLARAYALRGEIANAALATAQGHFSTGNIKQARIHARRAQVKLKRGTPAWLRADDIVNYKPPRL